MESFLSNKYQAVRLSNVTSNWLPVYCSVSQRTVLGPLLFLIYSNSLLKLNLCAKIISYADDTVILVSSKTAVHINYVYI